MRKERIIIGDNDGISNFIYESKDGKKYYFVPPKSLTQTMQVYFSGVMAQIGLGIETATLLQKLKEIENNTMDITTSNIREKQIEIIKITTIIEQRVSQLIPTKLMIKAASVVVFVEGETFELNTTKVEQKQASILEDSDATTFFYLFALVTLMNYKELSNNSAVDYLKAVQLEEMTRETL